MDQTFIKEVGTPNRKLVKSKEDYINFIKSFNGKMNIFETVYNYKYMKTQWTPDYQSAIVDKMFFDADSNNSWHTAIKLHEWLLSKDYKHYMKQSSDMRFHIIILCKGDLEYKKDALRNAQRYICKEVGLTFGQADECDIDDSTFGDLARLCRIPGSYNIKRKTWCNFISKEDLYSEERLKEKSQNPGGRKLYYGNKLFDLNLFDNIDKTRKVIENHMTDFDFDFDNSKVDKVIQNFPPFLQKVLADYNKYGNWKNRWRFAVYCRDMGLPKSTTDEIAKKYFDSIVNYGSLAGRGSNYDHFKKVKVIEFVYEGQEAYKFPPWGLLLEEGYEITDLDIQIIRNLYY